MTSSRERVDCRNSNGNDANICTRDHDEDTRNKDGMGLSKNKARPNTAASSETNDVNCGSTFQRFTDNATKTVKEEQVESPLGTALSTDRDDGHKLSHSSCTRDSNKLAPICSSPSRTAESSRTHMFSPQPSSIKVS